MVGLFQSSKANISEHIKNIFYSNEVDEKATVRKLRTVQKKGKRTVRRRLYLYNLDVIISQNKPRNLNNINHFNRSISSRGSGENDWDRSEEHTSELQSRGHLVCRLLLEKK